MTRTTYQETNSKAGHDFESCNRAYRGGRSEINVKPIAKGE